MLSFLVKSKTNYLGPFSLYKSRQSAGSCIGMATGTQVKHSRKKYTVVFDSLLFV